MEVFLVAHLSHTWRNDTTEIMMAPTRENGVDTAMARTLWLKELICSAGKHQHSSLQLNSLRQTACGRLARRQAGEFLKQKSFTGMQPVGGKYKPASLSRGSAECSRWCWPRPMDSNPEEDATCSVAPFRVPCFHTSKTNKSIPLAATPPHYPGTPDFNPHPLSQPAHSAAATQNYSPA